MKKMHSPFTGQINFFPLIMAIFLFVFALSVLLKVMKTGCVGGGAGHGGNLGVLECRPGVPKLAAIRIAALLGGGIYSAFLGLKGLHMRIKETKQD